MAGTAGIEPTHKIVPSALKSLSESKRKTLRSNFARERLGFAPWAVFRFLYRGQKSLNDAGVLTAYPVSPIPTNAELSDEEQLESEEENPENDETKPTGDLRAVSESQITDAAIVGRDSTGSIAVQDPSASGLANALDEDERDIIASVEEAPLQDMLIAPVTQTSLLIAKQSPIRDTSRSLKPMSPVTLVDSDQDVENSTLHLLKAFENPGGSDHVPDGLVSDEISAINETQAIRGLGLGLGGPRQYTGAPAPSAADKPGTPLTEQIETEGAVVFLAPPETSGPSIRNTKILFSNAEILPVDIKPSPRQSISRPWSFPSYELRDPQSSVVGDFSPSSVASPLAADNDADEGRDSPLFVSPGPQEGLKSGSVLGSGTPPTSPVKLTSNFNSGSLAPTPRTPNALKRSFGSLKLTGEEQQTFPRFDDSIEAIKRRKVDIKALKAELKRLAETKVDSARRVEEARRKREEHERTLNERYEALERQRLEVLKSIAADHDAEKEYLQGIEDESE
ncbi:hypothetical protein MMC17_000487 [Xylographa soralifera]|nr:hypothetical protein [Xylographa soralifera]